MPAAKTAAFGGATTYFICWNRASESCNHFSPVLEQDGVELVFAGTGKFFCWNMLDFLLQGHVKDFCRGRLVFAAIMDFFAGANVNFCWNWLIPFGTSNLFF